MVRGFPALGDSLRRSSYPCWMPIEWYLFPPTWYHFPSHCPFTALPGPRLPSYHKAEALIPLAAIHAGTWARSLAQGWLLGRLHPSDAPRRLVLMYEWSWIHDSLEFRFCFWLMLFVALCFFLLVFLDLSLFFVWFVWSVLFCVVWVRFSLCFFALCICPQIGRVHKLLLAFCLVSFFCVFRVFCWCLSSRVRVLILAILPCPPLFALCFLPLAPSAAVPGSLICGLS